MRRLERPLLCIAIAVVGVLIVRELLGPAAPEQPARQTRPDNAPYENDNGRPLRTFLG